MHLLQMELLQGILLDRIAFREVPWMQRGGYMGEVVNKITIMQTRVREGEAEGVYVVEVYWQLNGGSVCTYQGDYTLLLLENGVEIDQCSLQDTVGAHYTEQEFTNIKKDKRYTIILRTEQGKEPVSSEESKLLLCKFEDITGYFDGQELTIRWGKLSRDIIRGELTVWSDFGARYMCEVPVYSSYMKIRDIGFYPLEHIYVNMSGNDGVHTFGPESRTLVFCQETCELLTLEYRYKEEQTEVALVMTAWQEAKESELIRLVLRKQGKEILVLKDIVFKKQGEALEATVAIPYTKLRKEELNGCEVFCYREQGGALCAINSKGNHLSFLEPEITIIKRTAQEVELEWSYQGTECPDFYITAEGERIFDTKYTLPMQKADAFLLAAAFLTDGKEKRGNYAQIPSVFQEGYYPVIEESGEIALTYHQKEFAESCTSLFIKEMLFEEEPEFPYQKGGISLEKQESGYLLKVDKTELLTVEKYQEFLMAIKDMVSVSGFYCLVEAISRMAYHMVSDTAYFYCGYKRDNRVCDLRPGYLLKAQTEIYMPQESPEMDNSAGFVTSFQEEYPISFSMQEKEGFLEFNSFIDGYADFMELSSAQDSTNVIYAGGLRDFLTPCARQSFYRILYPKTLSDSGQAEVVYPSDNIVLLAAGSFGEIESATEAVLDNPSAINYLSIPILLFRGRSTLWTAMHIVLNGETRIMPVGITLGKVLQKLGIYCQKGKVPKTLRIYRRTSDGREVPLYWDWLDCSISEIVLVNGDRIEV